MNCGSVESFQVSARCGLRPNARQMRLTAVWLIPVARAIDRVDQWVAPWGVSSKVFTITCSTCASVIVRGTPGRGSSPRPSSRRVENRRRHLATVAACTPNCSPTSTFDKPSAQASTIRQRNANAWLLLRRCAHRCSVWRSSSDNRICTVGRPRRRLDCGSSFTPRAYHFHSEPLTRDTRGTPWSSSPDASSARSSLNHTLAGSGPELEGHAVALGQATPDPIPLAVSERIDGTLADHRATGTDRLCPRFADVALQAALSVGRKEDGAINLATGGPQPPRPERPRPWVPIGLLLRDVHGSLDLSRRGRSEDWVPAHQFPGHRGTSWVTHPLTHHRWSETAARHTRC